MSNTLITETEQQLLKSMVGGQFESYQCDPFVYSPMVFGIVGLAVSGKIYRLRADLKHVRRFFTDEEVACFQLEEASGSDIVSRMENGALVETPIRAVIRSISIVNDIQTVCRGDQRKRFASTTGILFHLEDHQEVSFELETWFSEMITVKRGYDLMKTFAPETEFLEEWEAFGEYEAQCRREVIVF